MLVGSLYSRGTMLELFKKSAYLSGFFCSNRPAKGVCEESLNVLQPRYYNHNVLKTDCVSDTVLSVLYVLFLFVLS